MDSLLFYFFSLKIDYHLKIFLFQYFFIEKQQKIFLIQKKYSYLCPSKYNKY
jgi:hypothetical protein